MLGSKLMPLDILYLCWTVGFGPKSEMALTEASLSELHNGEIYGMHLVQTYKHIHTYMYVPIRTQA